MRSLSVHPNHYKKNAFIQYKKRKMPSLSTKDRKAKFNANDLIFRKKFNLPSGTLLPAEYNSAESITNKYRFF